MRKFVFAAVAAGLVLAMLSPAAADPASQRDVAGLLTGAPNRYMPHEIGKPVDLHYVFGPYEIPPGQDSNRETLDIPMETGYIVAIAPDLVDTTNGKVPTQQEAHIHHAHWFRVTNDPTQEYYTNVGGQGLSWVFGTGEEKSQGRLDDRAALDPANNDADPTNDFTYGMRVIGSEPQAMIYMIHNKKPVVGHYLVILDVTFIPGTREQIKAATGKDIHDLYGQLWGQTKDVTGSSQKIGARWTVTHDGVAVAMGGHLHPGGKAVVISNLGPKAANGQPICAGVDPDGDGFDGVALLNSYKYDRDMDVWPYSENYQMGTTKYGWRAPVHKGDILEQQAPYALLPGSTPNVLDRLSHDVLAHNWYQAMSYTGIYMDRDQSPGLQPTECTMAALAPTLYGADSFDVQGHSSSWAPVPGETVEQFQARVDEVAEDWNLFLPDGADAHLHAIQGMVNHPWTGEREKLCAQAGLPALALKYDACGPSDIATVEGPEVTEIVTAGFAYFPGDFGTLNGVTPTLPKVRQGTTLTLVNADTVANVRHTFSSCTWPCIGEYVSNFPLTMGGVGSFDSGKLGNIDPIDGGLFNLGSELPGVLAGGQSDTIPVYKMEITPAQFPVGKYSYFCRIHPFMRGGFEVIAA